MNLSRLLIDALRPVRFPGKARLMSPMAPHSGSRSARVFGYRVTLDLGDHMGRSIYLGYYERRETNAVSGWLGPGMTFLDVGANVGYFTLLAARRVGPGGRVIAVEPSPPAFARLDRTAQENALAVERHQIGLGDRDGEVTLYLPDDALHNHSPTMVDHDGAGTPVVVPVRRLDDCLEAWGVSSVDLLKIDVEGFEPKVFAGGARSLASGKVKAILCEFNDFWLRQSGSSPQALHDTLTGLGFVDRGGAPRFAPGCIDNRFLVFAPPGGPAAP